MRSAFTVRSFIRERSGTTAVEFAIIAPVLLTMLAGILVYGLYFGVANSVQQLAADAARASVAGISDTERASIARARVASASSNYVLITPSRATVTAQPSAANPNVFVVAVSYDASNLAIWSFSGLLPLPSRTIVRTASIQRGGY